MMKGTEKKTRFAINTVFVIIAGIAMIVTVFFGSSPEQYDLQIGDISSYDIAAPLDFADNAETMRRALEAMAQIPNVMIRSDKLSSASSDSMRQLMQLVQERRDALYKEPYISVITDPVMPPDPVQPPSPDDDRTRRPDNHEIEIAVSSLISAVDQSLGLILPSGDADILIRMAEERFHNLKAIINAETNAITVKTLDDANLRTVIDETVTRLENCMEYYRADAPLVGRLLALGIRPNVEYNEEATEKARQAAYDRVMSDPVMINRGARIISQGDVITPETRSMLEELNLIVGTKFDWRRLASITLLMLLLSMIAFLFFRRYASELLYSTPRTVIALLIAILLPLIVSAYLVRDLPLSSPIYFAAVVVTAYFGFRMSIFVTSLLIVMIAPMTSFNPSFAIVALTGCLVASLFTKGTNRQDNYARIILATSLTTAATAFLVSFLQKESWALITSHVTQAVVSGALSVIIGIGIMPLFELIFDTVSPLRLIELSQPGHPLLKRLFVEAPGTSQHAMMVANLADTAAEAIGADAMIARVGAYFHDVGKLEAPLMFTENQSGENPHDQLTPLESARIITRHPEDSMAIGKKYRLPMPLLRIAQEHHGTTVLQYFWNKACREAEDRGDEPPPIESFRYRTPLPSTRESAIVMLADSTEAAMRSEGVKTLEQAEQLIKNIFKDKIDQEQLVTSGLSFADIETIIRSFLRVYAGHFHERVPYRQQKANKPSRLTDPSSTGSSGDVDHLPDRVTR
jgi:hypothetical protein